MPIPLCGRRWSDSGATSSCQVLCRFHDFHSIELTWSHIYLLLVCIWKVYVHLKKFILRLCVNNICVTLLILDIIIVSSDMDLIA